MNDVTVKVERKLILPVIFILIFISIFFLVFLIISIIYNLMGYYVYFIVIFAFIFVRLYLEIKWLNDVAVIFENDKLVLNVFVVKRATGKRKENFYYLYRPFTRFSGYRGGYVTSFAILEKAEIEYSDITNLEIIKRNDLEISASNKKSVIMSSFFHYQSMSNKWRSVHKQFSKEQIQFIYYELKKRGS